MCFIRSCPRPQETPSHDGVAMVTLNVRKINMTTRRRQFPCSCGPSSHGPVFSLSLGIRRETLAFSVSVGPDCLTAPLTLPNNASIAPRSCTVDSVPTDVIYTAACLHVRNTLLGHRNETYHRPVKRTHKHTYTQTQVPKISRLNKTQHRSCLDAAFYHALSLH